MFNIEKIDQYRIYTVAAPYQFMEFDTGTVNTVKYYLGYGSIKTAPIEHVESAASAPCSCMQCFACLSHRFIKNARLVNQVMELNR
jgi:hypothetical protein